MLRSNWPWPIPHHALPPTSKKIYLMISMEVCFIQMWISPSHTPFYGLFPALATNIYNLFISNPSPRFLFLSITCHYHLRHNSPHTHISLPYMVFECRHNIRNEPLSTIPFPSPFCNSTTTETHRHFEKIFIDIFFTFSKQDGTTINEINKFSKCLDMACL